jgi:Quinolinate synthetase A protein
VPLGSPCWLVGSMLPDEYLARNTAAQTPVEIIAWKGHCEVHERFTATPTSRLRIWPAGLSSIVTGSGSHKNGNSAPAGSSFQVLICRSSYLPTARLLLNLVRRRCHAISGGIGHPCTSISL